LREAPRRVPLKGRNSLVIIEYIGPPTNFRDSLSKVCGGENLGLPRAPKTRTYDDKTREPELSDFIFMMDIGFPSGAESTPLWFTFLLPKVISKKCPSLSMQTSELGRLASFCPGFAL